MRLEQGVQAVQQLQLLAHRRLESAVEEVAQGIHVEGFEAAGLLALLFPELGDEGEHDQVEAAPGELEAFLHVLVQGIFGEFLFADGEKFAQLDADDPHETVGQYLPRFVAGLRVGVPVWQGSHFFQKTRGGHAVGLYGENEVPGEVLVEGPQGAERGMGVGDVSDVDIAAGRDIAKHHVFAVDHFNSGLQLLAEGGAEKAGGGIGPFALKVVEHVQHATADLVLGQGGIRVAHGAGSDLLHDGAPAAALVDGLAEAGAVVQQFAE
ncbi:MAG TPA: hypothetical protein PK971_06175 [Saprospiraceae bacterium]|nr:hypothetical protein [Saprospiraceae bacterium]